MKRIYLDHNATTPIQPLVLAEMVSVLRDGFGNPSSIHWFGQQALRAIDRARERVADLIGANPREIVFVSGGTEANNWAIRGAIEQGIRGKTHIITSSIEHHAALHPCNYLESKGCRVTYLPVDEFGLVHPKSVADAITEDTRLISIMLANNDVGTIQPIRKIAILAREKGVLVHTDAVQAVGKIPVDVGELGVDLLSLSGHKIYGPKGIGALYIRHGVAMTPLIFGGNHEHNRRAGTENVPGIVGLGEACHLAKKGLDQTAAHTMDLRDKLEKGISKKIKEFRINGHPNHRLPNTLNVSFASVEGDSLLMNLDLIGIAASTGSACSSGTEEPSHVLVAMGRTPEEARSSIRFSLGSENTLEEVNQTIEALVEAVTNLRQPSSRVG